MEKFDLASFGNFEVRDMEDMFNNYSKLTSLNIFNFNIFKIEWMNQMFAGSSSLASFKYQISILIKLII